jgi:hypothetical protein
MRDSKADGEGRRLSDLAQRPASRDGPGYVVLPRAGLEAALFLLVIFAIYLASPIVDSSDSHFVLPTALNIVRHGDADIDRYNRQFPDAPWAVWQSHGRSWNVYPIGVPLLAAPLVFAADRIAAICGINLEAAATQKAPLVLELVFASLITAAAAALLFYYIRRRLPLGKSLLLAGLFALGTSAYSSASRGLWQHGPSMLLLAGAILIYDRLPEWGARGAGLLGIIVGYSYAVRPANVAAIAGFAVLLALTAWRRLGPYLCGTALGVAPLFGFHLMAYGAWSSYYYRMTQGSLLSLSVPFRPLAAILVSPSRGLFVFSPFLLFLFVRCRPSFLRRYRPSPLEILLAVLSVGWCIGVARWFMWWGGGSYGPRLLCDLLPFATVLLIPVVKELSLTGGRTAKLWTVLFFVAGALSIAVHARGATSTAPAEWNGKPVPVDQAVERVWSWKDPQFLRGLH